MTNYPQVELPVGDVDGSVCNRIAILYFRTADELPMPKAEEETSEAPKSSATAARKISASLAHEKKMLSIVNVFAILPVP